MNLCFVDAVYIYKNVLKQQKNHLK